MLQARGYKVVEYANEGSTSEAQEKVVMLTKAEFDLQYPKQKPEEFHGEYAKWGVRGWPMFNRRLIIALAQRLKPNDIVCHPFGHSHKDLPYLFPEVFHIEQGIGYPDTPFNCWRIFESQAWRHYLWGRDDGKEEFQNNRGMNRAYSYVIPNYFDIDDWPIGHGKEDYVLYMGRITPEKGMRTLVAIIRAMAQQAFQNKTPAIKWVFAGQGNFNELVKKPCFAEPLGFPTSFIKLDFRGPVLGKDRAQLVGDARCMVMPTEFIEPFGGAGVEGMLTGTPLLASGFGAFTETVTHGVNGYLCNTLGDWIAAIEDSKNLGRDVTALIARGNYSLERCGILYDRAFREIHALGSQGWNQLTSYRVGTLAAADQAQGT